MFFCFTGSSLEEILAKAREQPSSVEAGLVEDVDSEEDTDSSSEHDERFTKEPLVTLEAPIKPEVVEDQDSSSDDGEDDDESAFQFLKRDDADEVDLDKAEVILKSALVTDDQSSSEDEEDTEPQLAPVAVAELQQEQFSEPPPPVVNFDFEQQVQPADNRLNALDYPEDSGNADSSAPSSLESQSGPASVIVESQEVPTPDSAAFILKTSECPNSLDNLPTPQEAVVEAIPCSEVAQSPILEESEEIDESDDKSATDVLIDEFESKTEEDHRTPIQVTCPEDLVDEIVDDKNTQEDDLIPEEKAALSSLEEAINSAVEPDQELLNLVQETSEAEASSVDLLENNPDPIDFTVSAVDLLASVPIPAEQPKLVVDSQEELLEQPFVEEIIKESLADQVEEPVVASIDKEAVFEPFVAADKVEEEELTKPEIIADEEVAEEQPAPVLIETPAVFVPESIENTKVIEDIIIAKDLEVEQEVVPLPKDILELQTEQINAGEADKRKKSDRKIPRRKYYCCCSSSN